MRAETVHFQYSSLFLCVGEREQERERERERILTIERFEGCLFCLQNG
jgi:hypothetical protein